MLCAQIGTNFGGPNLFVGGVPYKLQLFINTVAAAWVFHNDTMGMCDKTLAAAQLAS